MIQERKGIKMGQDLVLYYFTQITLAIDYIHAMKILHRDIKTQNIFLNRKMTIVKVGDFGISKVWREWEVGTGGYCNCRSSTQSVPRHPQ